MSRSSSCNSDAIGQRFQVAGLGHILKSKRRASLSVLMCCDGGLRCERAARGLDMIVDVCVRPAFLRNSHFITFASARQESSESPVRTCRICTRNLGTYCRIKGFGHVISQRESAESVSYEVFFIHSRRSSTQTEKWHSSFFCSGCCVAITKR
jgi:hypothetical protein